MLTLPFPQNPFFTGREDQLQAIHTALTSRGRAALSGLGGIGKTQTAVEYAYRYRDDYRYVLWVRADTELELVGSYVAIAQALNLPMKDAENQDETVQYVRLWLSREPDWLLIFDNADRPELVQPFLPREIKGHILVTSRAQDFQDLGIVRPLEMAILSPAEAVAFLLTRTGHMRLVGAHPRVRPTQGIQPVTDLPDGQNLTVTGSGQSHGIAPTEYTAATDLAADLGYLPLALEQAAAYMVTNRVPFAAYLTSYRKQRLKRLEKAKPKLGHYPDSVATTWALNLKEIQKTAPAAATLLNYCAFLHPDAIPFNLFTQGAPVLGEPLATALADAADDPLELYDLLNPLCSYSLVRVEPESQSLSLHRLVQEVIRAELGDRGCKDWVDPLFRAMGRLLPEKGKTIEYQDWPTLAPLVNHVRELANHCQQQELASTDAADVFHATGAYLLERGQYALADPLLTQSLDLRRKLLGEEHEDIATSLNQAAWTHQLQGRYGEAEPLFLQALAMRQRLLGNEHSDVASSLNNLALLYKKQGRYREAEPLYQQALAMFQRLLGDEHPAIATSLNNLALLYKNQGRYSEAKPLFQSALAMTKRLLGDEHPAIATSLNNLALMHYELGQYSFSEDLYKEALEIDHNVFGSESPEIATDLHNLALVYRNQGKFTESERLFTQALTIKKSFYSEEHPLISDTLFGLGVLQFLKKDFGQATKNLQQALDLDRKVLGTTHPNTAESLRAIGDVYAAQDHTEEACTLYQQALSILEPKLGADHPWTVRCRENLAKVENGE